MKIQFKKKKEKTLFNFQNKKITKSNKQKKKKKNQCQN